MTTDMGTRRWTATITVVDDVSDLAWVTETGTRARGETVPATDSESDLQRDQAAAAYLEATKYILAGLGGAAYVQLYKTTQAHGTVKDQSYSLDRYDAVRYARRAINWQQSFHMGALPQPPR